MFPYVVQHFPVPILPSTESNQRNPDKQKLRETIMALYAQVVGIHQPGIDRSAIIQQNLRRLGYDTE